MLGPALGLDLDQIEATFGTPSSVYGVEKDDADLRRYAAIIQVTQPDVIVECGTYRGFSANWFAEQVPLVITIDINPALYAARPSFNVERLTGNTTDRAVYKQVRERVATNARVMVSLDSDHCRDHVAAEIRLWADLVTPLCYLVVEDGIFHFVHSERYVGDPLQAISDVLPGRSDYVRDIEIEGRFPVTGAIAGWWQRV